MYRLKVSAFYTNACSTKCEVYVGSSLHEAAAYCEKHRQWRQTLRKVKISLCILFSTLKYNMHIIHMGVTLVELCLLGRNTKHSQVGYIGHRCGRLF